MEGIDDLIEKENKQLQEDNYPCRDVKTEEREVVKDRWGLADLPCSNKL